MILYLQSPGLVILKLVLQRLVYLQMVVCSVSEFEHLRCQTSNGVSKELVKSSVVFRISLLNGCMWWLYFEGPKSISKSSVSYLIKGPKLHLFLDLCSCLNVVSLGCNIFKLQLVLSC